jgi:protein gp37
LQWHREQRVAIPAHVWLGVSVESMRYAWRVDRLRQVEAAVRFISAEPLLGSLDGLDLTGISWLIAGGESAGTPTRSLVQRGTTGLEPKPVAVQWLRGLRDACVATGVSFFFKQWGGARPTSGGRELDGRQWSEFPTVRQHQLAAGRP